MSKRPLLWLALAFCCGIACAAAWRALASWAWPAAALCLFSCAISSRRQALAAIAALAIFFWLGALALGSSSALPAQHIYRLFRDCASQPTAVKGYVCASPEHRQAEAVFTFETRQAQFGRVNYRCCGRVLVRIKGAQKFFCGEELILRGRLYPPWTAGGKNRRYRDYLQRQGIYLLMRPRSAARTGNFSGPQAARLMSALKEKILALLGRHTSPVCAAVLKAMVLGERKGIPAQVNNAMLKTGTVHILVVSGFNIGVVSATLLTLLKVLRLRRQIRLLLAAALLIVYCFLCGASAPVARATVMGLVFLLGQWLQRDPDIYNSLGLAALAILFASPRQLFDAGFQLSFASVASIAFLYPRLKVFLRLERLAFKPLRYLAEAGLVSFSAWMGTAGLIAYYFRIISAVTVLANIMIVPLSALVTLSGLSLVLAEIFLPIFAAPLARTCECLVSLLVRFSFYFASLPWAYFKI